MSGLWKRLAPREQIMVGIAGAFLLLALLIQGIMIPLHTGREKAREDLAVAKGTLTRLERLAASDARYVPPETASPADPASAASQLAQELGLTAADGLVRAEGRLLFRFDGAEAPVVFTWLERVETRTRLRLYSVDMLAAGDGRVQVKAEFTGAP